MNRKDLISHCLSYTGAVEDYPFEDMNSTVLRHGKSKKWFALIFEKDGNLCVNLKCEPMEADFLRQAFTCVIPAWHMNKVHWNTVILNGDVPEDEVFEMIRKSFNLTRPRSNK